MLNDANTVKALFLSSLILCIKYITDREVKDWMDTLLFMDTAKFTY